MKEESSKGMENNQKYVNIVHDLLYAKISVILASLLHKMGFSPNLITLISLLCIWTSAAILLVVDSLSIYQKVLYVFLIQMSYILDNCDGMVARYTNKQSKFGAWFDAVSDRLGEAAIFFAIAYYYYSKTGSVVVLFLLFFAVVTHLINCYAFAFHQSLKIQHENKVYAKESLGALLRIKYYIKKYGISTLFKGLTTTMLIVSIIPILENIVFIYAMFIYYGAINILVIFIRMFSYYKKGIK